MRAKTYSTGEAAKQIGVSRQTLQTWIASSQIVAPKTIDLGNVSVRLWTKADIERVRKQKRPKKR
jgi:excisionase family DNA binding protein